MNAGHGAAVAQPHARAVGVEDADDLRVDAVKAVVGHRHRLGEALGLVVDAARADRVDVAPVGLLLRVLERVAVDLGRRGEHEPRLLRLRQAERVVRAERRRPSASGSAARGSRSGWPGSPSEARSRPGRRRRCSCVTSCWTNTKSRSRRCAMLARSPVSRLSMPTTEWPRSSSASLRWDPMKPAAPVTTIRMATVQVCVLAEDRGRA